MKVRIARTALDAFLLEAQHSPEIEIGGLLTGADGEIGQAVPAANVASDPRRTFEIDPAVLLAAHRRARSEGGLVLGHYHSHPGGRPMPSLRDAASALSDGAIWLIVGEGGAIGAFRAKEKGRSEEHTSELQALMRIS